MSKLTHLQKVLGMTQPQFAKFLGIKRTSLQNIQIGRAEIPDELVFRMHALLGVDQWSLLSPHGPVTAAWSDKPYTRKHFEEWTKEAESRASLTPFVIERLVNMLELVFAASVIKQATSRGNLPLAAFWELMHAVENVAVRLQLIDVIAKEFLVFPAFEAEYPHDIRELRRPDGSAPSTFGWWTHFAVCGFGRDRFGWAAAKDAKAVAVALKRLKKLAPLLYGEVSEKLDLEDRKRAAKERMKRRR